MTWLELLMQKDPEAAQVRQARAYLERFFEEHREVFIAWWGTTHPGEPLPDMEALRRHATGDDQWPADMLEEIPAEDLPAEEARLEALLAARRAGGAQ